MQPESTTETDFGFQRLGTDLYIELKQTLTTLGLLKGQPARSLVRTLITLAMMAFGLAALTVASSFYIRLLDAAFLAFAYTQIAFLVHDAGHRQIAPTALGNTLIGVLHSNLLLGASFSWWVSKHNRHHKNPNQLGKDPDLGLSVLAFTPEQADEKVGVLKYVIKYQAYLFALMMLMEAYAIRVVSAKYLIQKGNVRSAIEGLLIIAHFALYFWLVFANMGAWQAITFIATHQALFGLYLGSVFAPNHKGMPIIEADREMHYLHRQTLTSRNIAGNAFIDFLYGALNYQIEHHLFPTIPRNKMRQAQIIIADFCRCRGIPYRQVRILESYRETLQHLHTVSSRLRTGEDALARSLGSIEHERSKA